MVEDLIFNQSSFKTQIKLSKGILKEKKIDKKVK
jgi:hypothetical protein